MPSFATEEEEANWWYDNREKHAERFIKALAEGRVRTGGRTRRQAMAEEAAEFRLTSGDARIAAVVAWEKGLEVQAYLAALVHAALQNEIEELLKKSDAEE